MSNKETKVSDDVKELLKEKKLVDEQTGKPVSLLSDEELAFVQDYFANFKKERQALLKEKKSLLAELKKDREALELEINKNKSEIAELDASRKDYDMYARLAEQNRRRIARNKVMKLTIELADLQSELKSIENTSADDIAREKIQYKIKTVESEREKEESELKAISAEVEALKKKSSECYNKILTLELEAYKINERIKSKEDRVKEISDYIDTHSKMNKKTTFPFKTKEGEERTFQLSRSVVMDDKGRLFALAPGKGANSTLLGSGTFGRVKIAQRLPISSSDPHGYEFVGVKIQKVSSDLRRYVKKEQKLEVQLKDTGKGKQFIRSSKKAYTFIKLGGPSIATYQNLVSEHKKPALTLADTLKIASSIATDLKERFHDQDIIHRDISRRNILLDTGQKQGSLIDFGMAINLKRAKILAEKRLAKQNKKLENDIQSETIEGQLQQGEKSNVKIIKDQVFYQGARFSAKNDLLYEYWPPEVVSGSQGHWFSKSSDIYGLGEVIFEDLNILKSDEFSKLDKNIQKELTELAEEMSNRDPFARPNINDVIARLETIQKNILKSQQAVSPSITTNFNMQQSKTTSLLPANKQQTSSHKPSSP